MDQETENQPPQLRHQTVNAQGISINKPSSGASDDLEKNIARPAFGVGLGGVVSKWTANRDRIVFAPLALASPTSQDATNNTSMASFASPQQSAVEKEEDAESSGQSACGLLTPTPASSLQQKATAAPLFSPNFLAQAPQPIPSPHILAKQLSPDAHSTHSNNGAEQSAPQPLVQPAIRSQFDAVAEQPADNAPDQLGSEDKPSKHKSKKSSGPRLPLSELEAREAAAKALMSEAGEACKAAWVAALDASREYRRVRKEWRRAKHRLDKRLRRNATAAAVAVTSPTPKVEPCVQLVDEKHEDEKDEQPSAEMQAIEEEPSQHDEVEAVEHAVTVLQQAAVEQEADELAAFQRAQLSIRASVAASSVALVAEALEEAASGSGSDEDGPMDLAQASFEQTQKLLQEQQQRYASELASTDVEEAVTAAVSADVALAVAHAEEVDAEVDVTKEEAELVQLTIESDQIKAQLAATAAEEERLKAEEEEIQKEQQRLMEEEEALRAQAAAAMQNEGETASKDAAAAMNDSEELENYVVTKPPRPTTSHTDDGSVKESTYSMAPNGLMLFSPPKPRMTGAQRKKALAASRAAAEAEKARSAALRAKLEADLHRHESRRQQLLAEKARKQAEMERRRQAAKEKVGQAEQERKARYAKVLEAAAQIEERAKARKAAMAAMAAAAEAAREANAHPDPLTISGAAAIAALEAAHAASNCQGCERCTQARLANADARRRKHLDEVRAKVTSEEDLKQHKLAQQAVDAENLRTKSQRLEENERRRAEAEARRQRTIEEQKSHKQAMKDKKRKELEAQLQELKAKEKDKEKAAAAPKQESK